MPPEITNASIRVAAFAGGAAADAHQVLELLLLVCLVEGRPLQRAQPCPDADGPQAVDGGLGLGREHDVGRDLDRVEALRIACLGQQPLRPRRIVGIRGRRPVELEVAGNDARRRPAVSQVLRVAEPLAIDGDVGGEPDAPVRPR